MGGASVAWRTRAWDRRPLDDAVAFFQGYSRDSAAAVVGWSAFAPLDGAPTPLDVEVDATSPAFATVMFGTNDIQRGSITGYADDMLDLVDALLARGVLPILSTIPPRDDSSSADTQVPRYNLVVRAIAEARVVPFFDLERRLRPLAGHGIGPDNLHLEQDGRGACVLDATGIGHGYNVRNLLALQALGRIKRAVIDGDTAPDADEPARPGTGSPEDPFIVDGLPFTAALDTTTSPHHTIDSYPACSSANESGAELFWRLSLATPARVHALVFDRGAVDIDIHLLDDSGACLDRDDTEVAIDLPAGEHTIVLDTFVSDAQAGEALLVVYAD